MPTFYASGEQKIVPRRSVALFALLAITMVAVSYIVIVLLAIACVYLPYLAFTSAEHPPAQLGLLVLGGIIVGATILWSLVPRREKFEAPGLLLEPPAHPRLFAELQAIAAALNEPLPREVYLVGQVNAFVADRGGIMGFGSRRVMGIGLPLLSSLTVSEMRAVLAHEFAHYYSGDTRMGPWVYKTQSAMIRAFRNIGSLGELGRIAALQFMNMVATFILKWYFIFFLRVINFVSRKKEYRADELACLVAGAEPLVQGLRKIHGASMAWGPYWNSEVVPVLNQGCKPAIADGFSRFLAAPQIEVQVTKGIEKEIAEGKTEPYDTHPPLRDRIAAIEKFVSEASEKDEEMAISLLDKPESTELQFLELVNPKLAKNSLRHVGWDEISETVTIPSWKAAVGEYAPMMVGITAGALPEVVKKLPQMGPKIRDPRGMLLTPQQRAQRAGQLLAMALGLALLEKGWKLEAQPGSFFLAKGADRINTFTLMDELVEGKVSPENWVKMCDELGITDLALALPTESGQAGS
ncbi:MAG TPA: M48 family metallopeptidase [Candidatus Binatus sp.]|nr:M48 family metallopeptidase [Candidatus Binatus sp.]